jgi:cytochrome bd-type quinol oxidase subunit 1
MGPGLLGPQQTPLVSVIRAAASVLGIASGLIGAYHGYNETLQGSTMPGGILINAIGPPCQGNACLPAMTVIPNFFYAGVVSIIVSLFILFMAVAFVQRKKSGLWMIGLSILQLLVGGGFLPPLLGIVSGIVMTRIKRNTATVGS